MNKLLMISLIFISSCGVIGIQEIPQITRSIIYGAEDIKITDNFFKDMKYSFVKVKIGKDKKDIFVLSNITDDIYSWIGPNNEKIYTKFGKIVKTSGLEYNIFILGDLSNISIKDQAISSHYLQLRDPNAILSIDSNVIKISSKAFDRELDTVDVDIYHEEFSSEPLRWQHRNIFYISESGMVIHTLQDYHPSAKKIELTFYYK